MPTKNRQLSQHPQVINISSANNNLLLANAVVWPDGSLQTTASTGGPGGSTGFEQHFLLMGG